MQPRAQILHKCFVDIHICFLDVPDDKYHLLFTGTGLGANPGNWYRSLQIFVKQNIRVAII